MNLTLIFLTGIALLSIGCAERVSLVGPDAGTRDGSEQACSAPNRVCEGACSDVASDPRNCGVCGNSCGTGSTCFNGECVPVIVGTQCTSQADCRGTQCLPEAGGWPGGYCTLASCTNNDECGTDGICASIFGACDDVVGATACSCQRRCVADADCGREGYVCVPHCAPGRVCETTCMPGDPSCVRYCVPSCKSVPGFCGENGCNRSGSCGTGCFRGVGGQQCSAGSMCGTGLNPSAPLAGQCRCTSATNCGPGRRCDTSSGQCVCANDSACPIGSQCVSGSCRRIGS